MQKKATYYIFFSVRMWQFKGLFYFSRHFATLTFSTSVTIVMVIASAGTATAEPDDDNFTYM